MPPHKIINGPSLINTDINKANVCSEGGLKGSLVKAWYAQCVGCLGRGKFLHGNQT